MRYRLSFCSCLRCFWPGSVPRGQRALLDSDMCASVDHSTRLVEPSCSLSFVPQGRLALFPWLPLTTVYRESCLCLHTLLSRCFLVDLAFRLACGLALLEVSCVIGSSLFFPIPFVRVPCLDVVVEVELLSGLACLRCFQVSFQLSRNPLSRVVDNASACSGHTCCVLTLFASELRRPLSTPQHGFCTWSRPLLCAFCCGKFNT